MCQISRTNIFVSIPKLIIIKFPYNERSDWLKQRGLSEIWERVDGIKLASKYLLRNLDKININELFVSSKYGS